MGFLKRYFLLILVLTLGASKLFATEVPSKNYYKTKLLCSNDMVERHSQLGKIWMSSFNQTGILPLLLDSYEKKEFNQFRFGEEFRTLIDDPDHFKAMNECFGSDEEARNAFFWGLYAADVSAKFAAWALDAMMIRVIWYGARAVWAAGFSEMPQRYMWFRTITRIAGKNHSFITRAAAPFALISVIAGFASSYVAEKFVTENMKYETRDANDKGLQNALKDYQDLLLMSSQTKNPHEQNLISIEIEKQKKLIDKLKARNRNG